MQMSSFLSEHFSKLPVTKGLSDYHVTSDGGGETQSTVKSIVCNTSCYDGGLVTKHEIYTKYCIYCEVDKPP